MTAGDLGGQRLVAGRYAVVGELGRGGIGVVWRAEDRVIGRPVALKELRVAPGVAERERAAFTERVLREARTAGRLNDPAIVTVYDVVPEDGAMFIVMELVEATTLAELVSRDGPLPPDRTLMVGAAVLSALETAHAAGIVHRDVKPSNIMMLGDGRVKLADFGIAQAMDDPSLTLTGGVMGSPGYMAPELFRGEKPGPASDLWSLGATLFHVVEGRAPFHRDTTAATLHAIMYEDPVLTRCQGPLATVIMGLLVHSVEDRLTAPQVRDLLTGEATTTVAMPVDDPERTMRMGPVRRSTRPYDTPADADAATTANPLAAPVAPHWGGDWAPEPRRRHRRRGIFLTAAAVVLVLALAGVALALNGPKPPASASGPVRHDTAATTVVGTSTGAGPPTVTSVSATPTTAATTTHATVVTTPAATTRRGSGGGGGGAPMPPPVPPPTSATAKLTYVSIARYHNTTNGFHLTERTGAPLPEGGYTEEGGLGYLVATNAPGTVRFFLCKMSGSADYFSSVDQTGRCEGQTTIGLLGYVYLDVPPSGTPSAPLYRCNAGASHYDSLNSGCEGNGTNEGRLGYVI